MKELLKGMAVNSATGLTKVWQDIFSKEECSKDLIIKLQQEDNQALQRGVEAIIRDVLENNPQILEQISLHQQTIKIKKVKASNGGIAIGAVIGSEVNINK